MSRGAARLSHKVNYTVARNRMHSETAHQLLYTYINLRLLNKCSKGMEDFLTGAIAGCDDENEETTVITACDDPVVEEAEELVDEDVVPVDLEDLEYVY